MNPTRSARMTELIKREASRIIQNEIKDPKLPDMLSVTRCELSADGKFAKLYISALGSAEQRQDAFDALRKAAGFIRTQLSRSLSLRHTPQLTFMMDDSIEYSVHISKLMDEIRPEGGYADDGRE